MPWEAIAVTEPIRLWFADAEATDRFGRALGAHLVAGDVLALTGDLGAGKTGVARAVAFGLGVDDPDAVASPTYLLVVEHPGPIPFVHMDAYLPGKLRAFLADGGVDYLAELRGVVAVEWADRVADLLPAHALAIHLEVSRCDGVDGRLALLHNAGRLSGAAWLRAFAPPC